MSVCVTFEIQWCEKTAMASYLITSLLVHGFVNTHFQTWRALSSEKQELREKNKRLIEPIKCFFCFFFPSLSSSVPIKWTRQNVTQCHLLFFSGSCSLNSGGCVLCKQDQLLSYLKCLPCLPAANSSSCLVASEQSSSNGCGGHMWLSCVKSST